VSLLSLFLIFLRGHCVEIAAREFRRDELPAWCSYELPAWGVGRVGAEVSAAADFTVHDVRHNVATMSGSSITS
jgi:hypothetical protein